MVHNQFNSSTYGGVSVGYVIPYTFATRTFKAIIVFQSHSTLRRDYGLS